MSTRNLLAQFDNWRALGEPLVLCTVIETQGSTYSKAGRQLLLRSDGSHAGLISGGCLEGDIANHAAHVLSSGMPQLITYDMRDDADDLWGIGLGCNGLIKLLLQRLDATSGWQPFADIAAALASDEAHMLTLVTASEAANVKVGTCLIDGRSTDSANDSTVELDYSPEKLPLLTRVDTTAGQITTLHWQTYPWPRLLILGGAPDAVPLVRLAHELGWEITLADHREHYLSANDFGTADKRVLAEPNNLGKQLPLTSYSAIIVMSHHLETDRIYLQQLAESSAAYIGLLGPRKRKEKLLNDLGDQATGLRKRLRGPVGLDIPANSPETIALSVIAEIQSIQKA